MSIRKTVVAGSFYPNNKNELIEQINIFSKGINQLFPKYKNEFEYINAIITPHAGYIYSGYLANLSFYLASKQKPKRVIVIGPSHHAYLEGSSICLDEVYETPLGNIEVDTEFSKALIEKYDFLELNVECAFEHSTETQAPFIKHYFATAKIVEIVYGNQDVNTLSDLINELIIDTDNIIVISSDLSHFHTLEVAQELDENCIDAINEKDINKLNNCEACGKIGIASLLSVVIKNNLKTKVLDYSTSCDVNNDKSRVVGYTTALIGK
jgi:AmmeMemoRadiSam system protein B